MTALAVGQVRRDGNHVYRIDNIRCTGNRTEYHIRWDDLGTDWHSEDALRCDELLQGHPWQNDPEWEPGRRYAITRSRSGRLLLALDAEGRPVGRIKLGEDPRDFIPTEWGPALTFDATGLWEPVGAAQSIHADTVQRVEEKRAAVVTGVDPATGPDRSAIVAQPHSADGIRVTVRLCAQAPGEFGVVEQVHRTDPLTREQLIEALTSDVPDGLNPDAWALAVPRVVGVHDAYADSVDLPDDQRITDDTAATVLPVLLADVQRWRNGRTTAQLPWQRHYDAAIWELRPRSCSGVHESCESTAGPYAPHQPRQCVRCGRALPMTIAEQASHDALWGITPLPKRLRPEGMASGDPLLRPALAAWRWAVCMAAKLHPDKGPHWIRLRGIVWANGGFDGDRTDWPRLYREGQRVTALARLEALRPADLDAAGWRRVCMSWLETRAELTSLDALPPIIEQQIRERAHGYKDLYDVPRPIETPWQGEGDPEVGP